MAKLIDKILVFNYSLKNPPGRREQTDLYGLKLSSFNMGGGMKVTMYRNSFSLD